MCYRVSMQFHLALWPEHLWPTKQNSRPSNKPTFLGASDNTVFDHLLSTHLISTNNYRNSIDIVKNLPSAISSTCHTMNNVRFNGFTFISQHVLVLNSICLFMSRYRDVTHERGDGLLRLSVTVILLIRAEEFTAIFVSLAVFCFGAKTARLQIWNWHLNWTFLNCSCCRLPPLYVV